MGRHRRALHLITATWDVASLYRNKCITCMSSSHDKSNYRYYKKRLPLGGNAVTLVTDEGEFPRLFLLPLIRQLCCHLPPRGKACIAVGSVATFHRGDTAERCISLRNEHITHIGSSRDKSLLLLMRAQAFRSSLFAPCS